VHDDVARAIENIPAAQMAHVDDEIAEEAAEKVPAAQLVHTGAFERA
jgi:hypothetical protein